MEEAEEIKKSVTYIRNKKLIGNEHILKL